MIVQFWQFRYLSSCGEGFPLPRTKSLEEIANDYQFILESDKAIWTATYKNDAEVDKHYAELEKVKKEKPDREEAIKLAEIANKQRGNRE